MSDRAKTTSAFLRLSAADREVDEEYLETALAESLTWTHPHGEPDAYAHEMAIAFVKMREELECWRKGEIAHSVGPVVNREPLVQGVIEAARMCEAFPFHQPQLQAVINAARKLAEWKP